MVWTYIDAYGPAAKELGVQVSGPTTLDLPSGLRIEVDILFRNFGTESGTFVAADYEKVRPYRKIILDAGYTFSVFDPPEEGYLCSPDDLAEMLAEWGWCGPPDDKPAWLPKWEAIWEARIAQREE